MIIIELPIVFAKNYKEVKQSEEQGIEVPVDEVINMTTFFIPDNCLIRMNEATDPKRTTIYFDADAYEIDANYETTLTLFKREIKK